MMFFIDFGTGAGWVVPSPPGNDGVSVVGVWNSMLGNVIVSDAVVGVLVIGVITASSKEGI